VSLPGPIAIPVVFDVNVLVRGVAAGNSPFRSWPSPPPRSGNACADCIGVMNDAAEWCLWVSPHILDNATRVLRDVIKWPDEEAELYRDVLVQIAVSSGGGVLDPPRSVHDCPDHEDNLVLDVAAEVGALVVVSNDTDLTALSPWRGVPILRPREFADRVDVARRRRRVRR
jgi:predicted nucleic acid-binding protein